MVPAVWFGDTPTPSFVRIALVADGTRNYTSDGRDTHQYGVIGSGSID